MKEATGELNMTVITVVAIAAVAAFFYAIVWPAIKASIGKNTCENGGGTWNASAKCCTEAGATTTCTGS
ncbi:MAG: hypothetical protein J5892_02560 [Bacilli bacterium]|nr:hypothetical protein [Bacilli bacterium]